MKKYIGNIVANQKYKVDSCFKKCQTLSEIDETLPTLIIGLQNAKNSIKDFKILVKKYTGQKRFFQIIMISVLEHGSVVRVTI